MARSTTAVLAAGTLIALAGCASPAPDASAGTASAPATDTSDPYAADGGAGVDDYCSAVHRIWDVTAESTPDGVVVRWDSPLTGDPVDFVVHRRAAGSEDWERLAEVTIDDGAELTHLDAVPASTPGTAYEYTVTRAEPDCGGESPTCADDVCEPAPSATPRED